MDYQAERLGLIVDLAEQSMDIVQRFSNDPIEAVNIQTATGPIKNLKQVSADIKSDGEAVIDVAVTELIDTLKTDTTISALVVGLSDAQALAGQSADRAELAAEYATAMGKIYASTAIGLLPENTLSGQYFGVISPAATDDVIVYLNNAGVALDTGKRYSSGEVAKQLESGQFIKLGMQMVSLSAESGYAWAIVDANQRAALLVDLGGAVIIPKYQRLDLVEQTIGNSDRRLADVEALGLTADAAFKFQGLTPESGYAWALVDSAQRAALLVDLSGAVVLPKFPRLDVAEQRLASVEGFGLTADSDFRFQSLSPESGFVWALVDKDGRRALAIDTSGKVVGNFDVSGTVGGYISSTKDLYFLGDSLTNGAGGQTTWREALAALVSPRTHTNIAIGGQTSPQIAARAGAYVALLTLDGNLIPASGPVAVTARTIGLLTGQGQQSIKGRLSGIYGTLTRSNADDSYSFTRETAGAPVPVGKKLAFAPDIGTHGFDTWLIFMGANNITQPDEIKRDIAAAVNAMKPMDKRFLVMTPVTGDSRYVTQCEQVEDWASQTYGGRVLKIREFSFQFNDGSPGDLADVAAGIIPRSLRVDNIHFTTFFHGKIAELVAAEINRRGW